MTSIERDADLDLSVAYLAELIDLEEKLNTDAPERFNEWGKRLDPSRWVWKLGLLDPAGQPITRSGKRASNQPVEVWLWSSRSTFYDPDKPQYTAMARKYMHALCGAELQGQDVSELLEESGLPFGLCGRRCVVRLVLRELDNGRKRLSVTSLSDLDGTLWWSRG